MAVSARLARFLRRHRVLGADTMVFAYHLQRHPRYVAATRRVLSAWEAGSHRGVASVLSLSEILVKPLRDADHIAVADYRRLLTRFPGLRLLEVSQGIAEAAARIRAAHGLALPDAVLIATAIAGGATGFLTNDPAFKRVPDIEVLLLDEVAPGRR